MHCYHYFEPMLCIAIIVKSVGVDEFSRWQLFWFILHVKLAIITI